MSPSRSNGVASAGLDNLAASPSQTTSLTQPLETKTFPAQLANTLETFGRQLDVLTQVHIKFVRNFLRNHILAQLWFCNGNSL